MPDVDSCVRFCELAMCRDIGYYARLIAELPDAKRVMVLRGKNYDEILELLTNCKKKVQLDIANTYYDDGTNYEDIEFISASNNNREGADVIHLLPDGTEISVELKFGQKTDRAIGMKTFEKIFETTCFTDALAVNVRKDWALNYAREPVAAKQVYRLYAALNHAVDEFNNFYDSRNRRLSDAAQAYMESDIINNTGDGTSDSTNLLKYIVEGEEFKEIKRIPTGEGYWTVAPVSLLGDGTSRVNIFVSNSTTNVQIKYTLNWKNNYRLPSGDKVSAKLGFGSPSWNVWIDVDILALS